MHAATGRSRRVASHVPASAAIGITAKINHLNLQLILSRGLGGGLTRRVTTCDGKNACNHHGGEPEGR